VASKFKRAFVDEKKASSTVRYQYFERKKPEKKFSQRGRNAPKERERKMRLP